MLNKTWLFESAPVPKAVLELAVPTIISQLIAMIYNMADTFFVGQTGDPNQVAAVSLAAPVMLVLTALANLFGIGGAALASRSLGDKNVKKAEQSSAFGFYASLAAAIFCALLFLAFQPGILTLLGAMDEMRGYTRQYLLYVLVVGGAPLLLSMVLAHFIRADGAPKVASMGLSMGGILNMILDPIFIFDWGFGLGVAGAAAATMLSNFVTLAYFLRYYFKHRKESILALHPKHFTINKEVGAVVLSIGFPSMIQTLLASVSNAVLNHFASGYGGTLVSGIGIAKKLDTIPMNVTIGLSQGVLPLLGYNHSAKNIGRMQKSVRFTLVLAIGFSALCVAVFELFTAPFVRLFIQDPQTVAYGVYFLRVMCVSTPLMAVGFLAITLFQAAGAGKNATLLSLLRKGVVDIPLIVLASALFPLYGLAYVQPVTEFVAMTAALLMYFRFSQKSTALAE
jgi:multidrug efflux pump